MVLQEAVAYDALLDHADWHSTEWVQAPEGQQPAAVRPPGCGKTHVGAALGRTLIENGYRVLFSRTTDLVQRLQVARQALQLEPALAKLDKYELLILDDLSYVHRITPRRVCCSS